MLKNHSKKTLRNRVLVTKKHLSFNNLVKVVKDSATSLTDKRQAGSIKYSLEDSCLSILAMFFFQSKSMLQFQRNLKKRFFKNNLETLFHVNDTPSDRQIKTILDSLSLKSFSKVFTTFFKQLQRNKILEKFEFMDGHYLVPMDASQYFVSDDISCDSCLTKKKSSTDKIKYSHQILQSAIVHPDQKEIIPFFPEAIQNEDGQEKQDCEINGGKRYLGKLRSMHPKLKLIIVGDDLYSKQPFIEEVKRNKMSYILVAKESDHTSLYKNIKILNQKGEIHTKEIIDEDGVVHTYRWANGVTLNKTKTAIKVNYFEYQKYNPQKDKVTFFSSWITDIAVSPDNVSKLVEGGRARWKIENEAFNTLKNHGYHLEHNFGHGKKNLSMNFFILNLIAFYIHQIMRLTDKLYEKGREEFSSWVEFWNNLRSLTNTFVFDTWEILLDLIIDPEKYKLISK